MGEESGWKLVHGDVFRPPRRLELLLRTAGHGRAAGAAGAVPHPHHHRRCVRLGSRVDGVGFSEPRAAVYVDGHGLGAGAAGAFPRPHCHHIHVLSRPWFGVTPGVVGCIRLVDSQQGVQQRHIHQLVTIFLQLSYSKGMLEGICPLDI